MSFRTINSRVGMREILAASLLTAASLFMSNPAKAQSFNCANAYKPAELAICNSENLIVLDEKMAKLHAAKTVGYSNKPEKQKFSRDSRRWLKQRNSCKVDFTCLELRYRERIAMLK